VYWASGLSLLTPLPFLSETRDAKAHFFVNAGRLATTDSQLTLVQHLQQRLWKPSVSTGLGLMVNFGGVRVELNYCFPVVFSDTDRPKSGFQFGVGYEYM
jgi:outer membrane protein assembly factor BamA